MTPNIIPETPKNLSKLVPERIKKQSRNTSGQKYENARQNDKKSSQLEPGQGGELTEKGILFSTGDPRLAQGGSWRSPDLQNGAKLPPNDPKSVIMATFLEPLGQLW